MWSRALKTNIAYALGSAANSAALVVLVPYFVNAIPPEEYGSWAIFEVGIIFLNMVIRAGMDVGLMREYWFLESEQDRSNLSGTVLIAVCSWGFLLVLGLGLVLWWLPQSSTMSALDNLTIAPSTLTLVLTIGFLEAIFTLLLTILRIREQAVQFVILSTGHLVVLVGTVIAGVSITNNVQGALIGRLLTDLLGVAIAGIVIRHSISIAFNSHYLKRVLNYGLPLLPLNIAAYVLLASDRYVLKYFSTLEIVAIYTFAYKIGTLLDVMVTRPFALDWAPRRFKIATKPDAEQSYANILVVYLFIGAAFALCVLAAAPTIYTLIAPPIYAEGLRAVPVILAAYLIYGLSYPLNVGIMLKDKTKYLPIIGGVSAGVCIGLNLWWIPSYEIMGAAWATLVAYGVWTGSIAACSLYFYPVSYNLRSLLMILLAMLISYLGIHVVDSAGIQATDPIIASGLKGVWILLVFSLLGYIIFHTNKKSILPFLRRFRVG